MTATQPSLTTSSPGQISSGQTSSGQTSSGPVTAPSATSLRMDLHRARTTLIEAELLSHPGDRFLAAHLAALRVAAIVLALRARPRRGSGRPRNAWVVLAEVAPELGEWAAYFAASQGKREAVRAGATAIITCREADDLVRDAHTFLALVERACPDRSHADRPPADRTHPDRPPADRTHPDRSHPDRSHAALTEPTPS